MNVDPGTLRAELQAVEDACESALSALDSVRRQLDTAEAAEAAEVVDAELVDDDAPEPAPADEPAAQPDVEPAPAPEPEDAA